LHGGDQRPGRGAREEEDLPGSERPGTGIAFQVDVEDAVGVEHQVESITPSLEEEEL
jgi:hypothetical protein